MADKGGGRWDVGRDWTADDDLGWRGPRDGAQTPASRQRPGSAPPPVPPSPAPRAPAPPAWPGSSANAPAPDVRPAGRAAGTPAAYGDDADHRYRAAGTSPSAAVSRPGVAQRSAPGYQRYGVDPGGAATRMSAPYVDEAVGDPRAEPVAAVIRPTRVLLLIALAVSTGVVVYGFFVEKSGLQVPISVVGLAMLGVSLLLTALASLRGGIRVARAGSRVISAGFAIFGGLCALAAAGSLASALILGLLYQPPS